MPLGGAAYCAETAQYARIQQTFLRLMNISDTIERVDPPSDFGVEGRTSLLEAIVQSSEDAIISKNLDGIVTSWNPAAARIFGYRPEEMIGQSILKLIPPHLHHQEPFILGKLRAGEQIAHFETERVSKEGRRVFVLLTISPVRDASGIVIGVSKIARDITDQKQMEIARSRLAAIVESADDAILSKDLNGIITSWNGAATRTFGYTEEEMVGASILTLVPQELHPEEAGILGKIRAGERIEHYETVRLTKDKRRLNVSLTISPLRDSSGAVVGASKVLRDITQRKRMEQSLIQAGTPHRRFPRHPVAAPRGVEGDLARRCVGNRYAPRILPLPWRVGPVGVLVRDQRRVRDDRLCVVTV